MRITHPDILLLARGLLLCLTIAAFGWVGACIFFNSLVLNLLGGNLLFYALLFMVGLALGRGDFFADAA